MYCLDKFIAKNKTQRQESMFCHDIERNKYILEKKVVNTIILVN